MRITNDSLEPQDFFLIFRFYIMRQQNMNTYMCEVGSQSAVACCCGVKNFSFISFSLIHSLTSSAGSRSHSLSQPLSLSSFMLSLSLTHSASLRYCGESKKWFLQIFFVAFVSHVVTLKNWFIDRNRWMEEILGFNLIYYDIKNYSHGGLIGLWCSELLEFIKINLRN